MLDVQRSIPIWWVLPIAVTLLALTVEIGYRVGRRARRRPNHEAEQLAADLATPAIGLFGLMLAFTFGWAATRYDSRLNARFGETAHIGNAFRLADFLIPADRDRTRALLREYLAISLEAKGVVGFQQAFAKREVLHRELWSIAVREGRADPNSEITAAFVHEIGEVLNSHVERSVLAVVSRIPVGIAVGLAAILVLTMLMIGYQMGLTSPVRSPALIPLILSVAIVTFIITDLDRPLEGVLRLRDRGLVELQRELRTWP